MQRSSRDRISVDLQGLKGALHGQAQRRGLSPSALVREVLARALDGSGEGAASSAPPAVQDGRVRVGLRMPCAQAQRMAQAARRAGMRVGDYVAGLVEAVPVLASGLDRGAYLTGLLESNAELATLSRSIQHLALLLSQGDVRPALEYRDMLDSLGIDVRKHLTLAARALADLRPKRAAAALRASGAQGGGRHGG